MPCGKGSTRWCCRGRSWDSGAALLGTRSNAVGIVAGLSALALGLFIEWQFAPFVADKSLGYFLAHLHQLRTMTIALIVIGALLGFAFGRGREGGVWPRAKRAQGCVGVALGMLQRPAVAAL